jgi:hypothetical protein
MIKTKIKKIAAAAMAAGMTIPALALAQFNAPGGTNLPSGSIFGIIQSIMNWLLGLVGVLGVIGFAIAGILYLTAAGDEEKMGTAKKALTYSIIGVIVALLGLVILQAAAAMLGGSSTTF